MTKKIPNTLIQSNTITKIINALCKTYEVGVEKLKFEKSITHEFYHQLRIQNPILDIAPEYPVNKLIERHNGTHRYDFYLYKEVKGRINNKYSIVIEFKKDTYDKKEIMDDFEKLKKLQKRFRPNELLQNLRPILVIFFTTELDFWRYHNNFFDIFYKNEVRVVAIAPRIKKTIRKKDEEEISIDNTCIITNFQSLTIPKEAIKIIHPRKSGQIKKTELHINGKKEDLFTQFPRIKKSKT
jgi:hypothetical protein